MPCGASVFSIRVVSVPGGGGNFDPRDFTTEDLNQPKSIGRDVNATTIHQFRIQAWIQDYDKVTCPDPSFKGEICYPSYADPPNCKKEEIIAIVVPIVTAIIGTLGGVLGTVVTQRCQSK